MCLTGNQRLHVKYRLFRKPLIVLQVEEEYTYTLLGRIPEDRTARNWRNARPEDLINIRELKINA